MFSVLFFINNTLPKEPSLLNGTDLKKMGNIPNQTLKFFHSYDTIFLKIFVTNIEMKKVTMIFMHPFFV